MTQNRWLVAPVVAGLLACPALLALTGGARTVAPAADYAVDDGAEQLQEILDDYDDAVEAYNKAARAASSREERAAITRVKAGDFTPKVRALAEKHAGTETAAKGLSWIYLNARGGDDGEWALEVLTRDHVASAAIGKVCLAMSRTPTVESEALVRAVAQGNRNHAAQGEAKYALANMLLALHEVATDGPDARRYRSVTAERVAGVDAEALEREYLALFADLAEKYSDVPFRGKQTIGARAEGILFKKTRLKMGMVAPDIEAEDVDGVTFKLSDYRGKVVVIDFWGDW
jgi:hypothetical protein